MHQKIYSECLLETDNACKVNYALVPNQGMVNKISRTN